jgi:hypothetical protein
MKRTASVSPCSTGRIECGQSRHCVSGTRPNICVRVAEAR